MSGIVMTRSNPTAATANQQNDLRRKDLLLKPRRHPTQARRFLPAGFSFTCGEGVPIEERHRNTRMAQWFYKQWASHTAFGLCQRGAADMARHGASFREILGHYYPSTASKNNCGERPTSSQLLLQRFDVGIDRCCVSNHETRDEAKYGIVHFAIFRDRQSRP
jgi:hypothetical protein